MTLKTYETVLVEKDGPITWVTLNRPEKRNAMSPQLCFDMVDVLTEVDTDPECLVMVLTGAGESFTGGMDLREFFRALDDKPREQALAREADQRWNWRKLSNLSKPTIAMVNGYCIGGGFTQTLCCDFALAAEDATFCLSEVNWGILPGGLVSKKLVEALRFRDAMLYACTGRTFDGRRAAEIGMVNFAVPKEKLREETVALARELMEKNPEVLRATKQALRAVRTMSDDQAFDYLAAKSAEIKMRDKENAYHHGLKQFIDDKSYKPTFSAYDREKASRD